MNDATAVNSSPAIIMPALPNPTLGMVIARIESSDNQYAIRFEPTVWLDLRNGAMTTAHAAIVAAIQEANMCSVATAQIIYSMSYGKYQEMGFNLYSTLKWTRSIGEYFGNGAAQDATFYTFCIENRINFDPSAMAGATYLRETFARIYNGDVPAYSASIVSSLQHFGLAVK